MECGCQGMISYPMSKSIVVSNIKPIPGLAIKLNYKAFLNIGRSTV